MCFFRNSTLLGIVFVVAACTGAAVSEPLGLEEASPFNGVLGRSPRLAEVHTSIPEIERKIRARRMIRWNNVVNATAAPSGQWYSGRVDRYEIVSISTGASESSWR